MKKQKINAFIFVVGIVSFIGLTLGVVALGADNAAVTATVSVSYYSVTLSESSFDYGTVPANSTSSTVPLFGELGITATNTGSLADIDIFGANTVAVIDETGGWTLHSTSNESNQYMHKFCEDTTDDCTDPITNYDPLTTDGTLLWNDLANDASVKFQLHITTPQAPTDVRQQKTDVTVQASDAS